LVVLANTFVPGGLFIGQPLSEALQECLQIPYYLNNLPHKLTLFHQVMVCIRESYSFSVVAKLKSPKADGIA
jgi:hypothetical protein